MPSSSAKKRIATGSTDGKSILVEAVSSPGTPIHTAVAGTTPGTYDELWLWAYNGDTEDQVIYIEEDAGDTLPMTQTIPFQAGWVPIEPGFIIQNGVDILAYASKADVIKIRPFVHSITD